MAASLIDSFIFLLVIALPITLIFGTDYWAPETSTNGIWDVLLQYVLPIVLTVWFWKKYLGTPGKMLLRLRVVDARTGHALSTGQAIGRYLGYYVSAILLMTGFLWIGIDKRKQGFHDKLAGTVVVRDTVPVQFES